MFKTNIFSKLVFLTLTCLTLMVSCSPKEPKKPTDETKNKLHEDPFKAEVSLQAGTLKANVSFNQATLLDFQPIADSKQTITWETSKEKGWHIKDGSLQAFQVVNQSKAKDLLYLLRIVYYNAKGEVMNEQFVKNGQDKIHQHFFSIYKNHKLIHKKTLIPYDYTYQDTKVWNDDKSEALGAKNPIGLKGFIRFKPKAKSLSLAIELVHAFSSKYEKDGSVNPFYFSGKRLRGSEGTFDISIRVPFLIEGTSEDKPQEGSQDKANDEGTALDNGFVAQNLRAINKTNVKKVVIKMYEGHLHGLKGFHYIAGPSGITNPFLRLEQELTFEYIKNKWCFKKGQVNKFVFFKSKMYHNNPSDKNSPMTPAPVYGCWIDYYDAEGKHINGDFVQKGAYQHFFIPRQTQALDGHLDESDKEAKNLLNYVYRDTTPWDREGQHNKARFNDETEPLGLKGFFNYPTLNRNFLLSIQLWQTNGAKLTNGKASPFYAPSPELIKQGEKVLELNIPTYVLLNEQDKELDEDSSLEALEEGRQKRLKYFLNLSNQTWAELITDIDNRLWGEYGKESEGRWF